MIVYQLTGMAPRWYATQAEAQFAGRHQEASAMAASFVHQVDVATDKTGLLALLNGESTGLRQRTWKFTKRGGLTEGLAMQKAFKEPEVLTGLAAVQAAFQDDRTDQEKADDLLIEPLLPKPPSAADTAALEDWRGRNPAPGQKRASAKEEE